LTLRRAITRVTRLFTHTPLAYLVYRYRYLALFTVFGFLSVLVEVVLARWMLPPEWPFFARAVPAFLVGLALSFLLNATFNFRVPRRYLVNTFARFTAVAVASFCVNLAAMNLFQRWWGWPYALSRFVCAATLFLLAYSVHRRLTFQQARNFGIAVYASSSERVHRIFHKVGRSCDHIHIDLVDDTLVPRAGAVDLSQISRARRLWPGVPFALHLMSKRPSCWLSPTESAIDWYLFHLSAEEDLLPLVGWCHLRGKKAGVVWHQNDPIESLYHYLPHVDFVMTLGIAEPGRSGQPLSPIALEVTDMLDRLRSRYGFELMFDGSVNASTADRIRAKYLVAASAVLRSSKPAETIYSIKSGGRHGRLAA
jgi:pentose-5-phosphate-3-epimerase